MTDPAGANQVEDVASIYIADPELETAAQVAMEIGQPLLLTGEPGTGKTTFAGFLATHLAPRFFAEEGNVSRPPPFALRTFETKSSSVATDLFYRFDSLRRFQAAHDPSMSADNRHYIAFDALGHAILESLPWRDVADLMVDPDDHVGPRRTVVLIDEVDKAPRDFPNDLLNEIQRMFFRIPEISFPGTRTIRHIEADPTLRPIVILTSNSEKNLPLPFLRRCVFHHIRFPDRDEPQRLSAIVKANLMRDLGPLADSAIAFFYDIREELQLNKLPTTHELVQWIRVLHGRHGAGGGPQAMQGRLEDLPFHVLKATFGVIGKTADDLAQIEALAQRKLMPASRGGLRAA